MLVVGNVIAGPYPVIIVEDLAGFFLDPVVADWRPAFAVLLDRARGSIHGIDDFLTGHDISPGSQNRDANPDILVLAQVWVLALGFAGVEVVVAGHGTHVAWVRVRAVVFFLGNLLLFRGMLLDLALSADLRQGLKDWNDHQARNYGNQQHSYSFMVLVHQLHSFPNFFSKACNRQYSDFTQD